MKKQVENLYDFCYGAENSYYKDKDITDIFHNGITPENILEASRTVKYKEKSMFLRLPVNFISQANARTSKSIEELLEIIKENAREKLVNIAVAHGDAFEEAQRLCWALFRRYFKI